MKGFVPLLVVCAATAAPSAQAQDPLAATRAACAADAQKFCAGVQPGGGRIVACLKEHKDSLSDQCKQAAGLPVGATSGSSGAAAPAPEPPAAGAPAKPAPAPKAPLKLVVGGEHFVQRAVIDTQQGGMTAATVYVPENWHFESKIEWNYGWIEVPVATSWHADNPANAEAYFQYPLLRMATVDAAPQYRQYIKGPKPGDRYFTGAINMAPLPPLRAMASFIQKVRPDVANLKWLGSQDLPGLGKALRLDVGAWPTQHGVAIKIAYDLNSQAVEEAFFGVYYLGKAGTQAVQVGHVGMAADQLQQTNWGIDGLQSFRAPAGTLDKRMPIFCLMAKSVQYDAKWIARQKAIDATLARMFNQKLQQGYDQMRAAQALSDQTMRDQAQFLGNVERQEVAMRSSGGSSGGDGFLRDEGGRSSSDNVSDLIRGVDTLNDPSTGGTKQLSNLGQYHFTDGFGNYRTSDDPNYTPEQAGDVGSWSRMTAVQ